MSYFDTIKTDLKVSRIECAQGEWVIPMDDPTPLSIFYIRIWEGEQYEDHRVRLFPPPK